MSTLGGVNGTVCDAQQYQLSLSSPTSLNPSISCLTHGQTIGLALVSEASFISFVCVAIIFILIGRNVYRHRKVLPAGDWKLLRTPADIYMFSLFFFDIIQAVGGILNVRWAGAGNVTTGSYCSAQGIIKQIGELGTAAITFILAVHTFIAALWGIGIESRSIAFGLVGLTCVFTALWVGIGNGVHKNYEAPSPYWCWISPRFNGERLAGEYLWLWVALFASIVMYFPLYLWAEGRLSVGDRWYKFNLSKPDLRVEYANRRAALGMLFYPLAYSLVVIPLSVARWSYSHNNVPSVAFFIGASMFNLSGAINVILFLIIRPELLLFTPPAKPAEPEAQISHLNIGPMILPDTPKCERSTEQPGIGLVNDLGERSRNSTFEDFRNIEAPPCVSSTQRSDDI